MSEEVLTDRWDPAPVRHRELMYAGLVWDVRRDRVDLGREIVERDVVAHPGHHDERQTLVRQVPG